MLGVTELSGWPTAAPLNPFKPALSGLAFSTHHSGSCHRPSALGKVSGLLQNILELYLTPGSRPNQKYMGWNLQRSPSKPGGWRREAALDHRLDMRPTHSIFVVPSPQPSFTCTVLLNTTLSSCEVVFKTVDSILSPGFAEKEEKRTIPPQTESSLLHTIPPFLLSLLICGRLLEGQDNTLCGGAVWNSPENARDNGSSGSHTRLGSG